VRARPRRSSLHHARSWSASEADLGAPRRRPRRTTGVLLALAAALLLVACGDDATETPAAEPADEVDDELETAPETDDGTDVDAAAETAETDVSEAAEEADTAGGGPVVVYSGRNEELVGSIFEDFTTATGIEVEVRYGDTAELAATIVEEGDASPADVYFAQDAGALGALESDGRFVTLPDDVLELVDPLFRSREGSWTATTGRVRVLAYNTDAVTEDELPDSVLDLTDPSWSGRIGWAPTNGSFQAFVTALRVTEGEDAAREWLEGIIANDPVPYENNTALVEGVARGEVDVGLTNHYYLYRLLAEDPDLTVENHFLPGDIGGLVNIAGVGVLSSSEEQDAAVELVRFLLSEEVQTYFGQVADALEFPVRTGIDSPDLPTLQEIDPPEIDLGNLEDLQGTLELLQEVGALQ
jgi:iron(III) transport system substrate-binding protein